MFRTRNGVRIKSVKELGEAYDIGLSNSGETKYNKWNQWESFIWQKLLHAHAEHSTVLDVYLGTGANSRPMAKRSFLLLSFIADGDADARGDIKEN